MFQTLHLDVGAAMETPGLVDIIALVMSVAAFGLSGAAYKYSRAVASTELFVTLRSRYLELHQTLPDALRNPAWVPARDSAEWRTIETYWYVSFDEWFATRKIENRVNDRLWTDFYSHAIRRSLETKGMRMVLVTMLHGSVSFGSFRDEFRKELTAMWRDAHPGLDTLEQDP